MFMDKNKYFNLNLKSNNILFIIFSFFPIAFLIGNSVINIILFFTFLFYFISLYQAKINFNFKDKIFLILILFWLSLIINLIFSQNPILSYPRVIKFFIIIFSVLSFVYIINLNNHRYENKIYMSWTIILGIVILDLIFEYVLGFNILGFQSYMPGRLASFFGDELIVGNFFSAFSLIFLTFILNKFSKKNNLILVLATILILVSFLIGERANFIKTTLMILVFIYFAVDYTKKIKLLYFLILVFFIFLLVNLNQNYKLRYVSQLKNIFQKNGIQIYLKKSQYGAHYNVAYKIFKENLIFGVGIKNFRVESFKDKYKDKYKNSAYGGGSTHPHQIHFELLSETGLFGYFSFLIFIIFSIYKSLESNFTNKNLYQFSGILYVCSTLLPVLPSGSFFSTFSSGLFWINYSVMVAYIKN
jgi:O-antigen ligase